MPKRNLDEALRKHEKKTGRRSAVDRILDELPAEDKAQVEAALLNPEVAASALAGVMRDWSELDDLPKDLAQRVRIWRQHRGI